MILHYLVRPLQGISHVRVVWLASAGQERGGVTVWECLVCVCMRVKVCKWRRDYPGSITCPFNLTCSSRDGRMQQRESGKRVSLSTMFQAVLIDFLKLYQYHSTWWRWNKMCRIWYHNVRLKRASSNTTIWERKRTIDVICPCWAKVQ